MRNNKLTTFYIVRHGETDWNTQKKIQGQTDIPLNEKGEAQAKALAKKFDAIEFDLAFSSDLIRVKRTTEIIALEHRLAVETTKLLRERDFGKYEGQHSEVLRSYLANLKKVSHQERFTHRIEEGVENDEELATRILTFLREIAISNPAKKILIGTHGGVLRTILVHLGYFSYQDLEKQHPVNGAHVILESDGIDFFIKEVEGIEKYEGVTG